MSRKVEGEQLEQLPTAQERTKAHCLLSAPRGLAKTPKAQPPPRLPGDSAPFRLLVTADQNGPTHQMLEMQFWPGELDGGHSAPSCTGFCRKQRRDS